MTSSERRVAKATAIFFAVALINPRDFPINNVPLIYPGFVLFWMQIGTRTMLRGFMRVRYLFALLVGYQTYFTVLRMYLGMSVQLGEYAYIIEPAMILVAASAAAVRPGGTKAATWAFVSVIAFMAAWGVGIYTIGEPFTAVRSLLQRSVGGTVASGVVMRDMDFELDLTDLLSINSGLASDVVIFGYMLAAATTVVMTAMLAKRRAAGVSYGFLAVMLLVLIAGIITNTERATVVAVMVGVGAFMFTDSIRKAMSTRTMALLVVGAASILVLASASQRWAERGSLLNRGFVDPTSLIRLYMSVPAVASVVHQPLGAGGTSSSYEQAAFEVGWVTMRNGYPQAHSPHNHFAGIIMLGGVAGLLASLLLFGALVKRLRLLRRGPSSLYGRMLAAACVASVFHSLFHNAGFFGLVPPTQIVFGLLWSEMWAAKRRVNPVKEVREMPVAQFAT